MSTGLVDRFRSLPMSRWAVLTARTIAELLTQIISAIVVVCVGLAIGWRVHTSAGDVIAAFRLALLFGYAFTWAGDPRQRPPLIPGPAVRRRAQVQCGAQLRQLLVIQSAHRPAWALERQRSRAADSSASLIHRLGADPQLPGHMHEINVLLNICAACSRNFSRRARP